MTSYVYNLKPRPFTFSINSSCNTSSQVTVGLMASLSSTSSSTDEDEDESSPLLSSESGSDVDTVSCMSYSYSMNTLPVTAPTLSVVYVLGLKTLCSCASAEEWTGDWYTQSLCRWKSRSVASSSSHFIDSQSCFLGSVIERKFQVYKPQSSSSSKSRSLISRSLCNLSRCEPKRSYIQSTPTIPYTFHHYESGDISRYIEDYRNSYTYPNIEDKNKKSGMGFSLYAMNTVMPKLLTIEDSIPYRTVMSPTNIKREASIKREVRMAINGLYSFCKGKAKEKMVVFCHYKVAITSKFILTGKGAGQ